MVIYNINKGVKRLKTKTQKFILGTIALAFPISMVLSGGTAAALSSYTLTPWTFVGALGDCGAAYPAGTPGNVVSKWDYTTGNSSPSLYLQKSALTTDCSSSGATINGVSGIQLTELNFDYKTGSYCGAGAPRFDVSASDGSHFMGGCSNGTKTDLGNGWTHVVINPTNAAQAFPVLAPSATINSIDIVFDEQGNTNIDNISINSQTIGGPNTPTSKDQCKNNGWKNFTDNNGKPFKNQGDCVSFVNSSHKNINNVNINNSSHQTAKTGNARVNGNSTGGNATSGDALNRNSTTNNVNINN